MAQSQQPERDSEADFVSRIVTDPNNVPDIIRLYGYLGASSEENHERLYLNPDLSVYVEVPGSAIMHRVTASPEQDPNRGVMLWVRRDAALIYKSAPAAQALASYFAGAIAGAAAVAGAMAPATPIPEYSVYWWAPCGTRNTPCIIMPPAAAGAMAPEMPIQGIAAPTPPIYCATRLPQNCPTIIAHCGGNTRYVCAAPGAAAPVAAAGAMAPEMPFHGYFWQTRFTQCHL